MFPWQGFTVYCPRSGLCLVLYTLHCGLYLYFYTMHFQILFIHWTIQGEETSCNYFLTWLIKLAKKCLFFSQLFNNFTDNWRTKSPKIPRTRAAIFKSKQLKNSKKLSIFKHGCFSCLKTNKLTCLRSRNTLKIIYFMVCWDPLPRHLTNQTF